MSQLRIAIKPIDHMTIKYYSMLNNSHRKHSENNGLYASIVHFPSNVDG